MNPESRKKRKACVVVDGTLDACSVLEGALQDADARSGLVMIQNFNSITKKINLTAVTIRSVEWKGAGWHISYCPFCGADIRTGQRGGSFAEAG